jgi:hypothetical protein
LYEYVGTGDREPVLVGVRNEGPLQGNPYVNDGAELVSRCGTALGGSNVGGSLDNAISTSGELVYFTALACGASPSVDELYARVSGERTVAISEPTTGPAGDCEICNDSEPAAAAFQGASEDGAKVFFTSEQELLPGARGDSLYEYDFNAANQHERLTLIAPEVEGVAAISQDGWRIYFQSPAVLVDGANGNGETAQKGGANLYVYDTAAEAPGFTGKPVFVAKEAADARTTRDGKYLVFQSSRHIADTNDTSVVGQIFEYDAETDVVARVSIGQTSPSGYECQTTHLFEEGFDCDGNATSGESRLPYTLAKSEGASWAPTDATSGLTVAADGTVEFESTIALTPLAVSGNENIYEYRDGDLYLISAGVEAVSPVLPNYAIEGATRALGIGESGQDVFFATTESLVPQGTVSQTGWYDAREDGGFPAPAEQPACAGACQGALSPSPVLPVPATATTVAGMNITPVPPPPVPVPRKRQAKCRKGYAKNKGKCVKVKAKRPGAGKASAKRATSIRGSRP